MNAKKAKEDAQDVRLACCSTCRDSLLRNGQLAELWAYKVPEKPAPATPAPAVAPPALKTEIPDVEGLAKILKPKLQAEEKKGLDEVEDPKAAQAIVDKAVGERRGSGKGGGQEEAFSSEDLPEMK